MSTVARFLRGATSYWLTCLTLYLAMASHLANGRRAGDVYLHVAAIERLAADVWSPANPMLATQDPDPSFSPYGVLLGLVCRWTGWSGFTTIDVAGLVLLAIFLLLFRPTVGVLTGSREAATVALLFTLLGWGIAPWRWSGYLNLNSIGQMLGYPSMAAWCLLLAAVLITSAMTAAPPAARRCLLSAALTLTIWGIVLTHPITLAGTAPLALGVAWRTDRWRGLNWTGGCIVLGIVASLGWPLYPVEALLTDSPGYDAPNKYVYRGLLTRSFLVALGIPTLWLLARRERFHPLVIAAAFATGVVTMGAVTERWTAGRAFPFLVLAVHLAAAGVAARWLADGPRRQRIAVLAILCLVVIGLVGSPLAVASAMPRTLLPDSLRDDRGLQSETRRLEPLEQLSGEVAIVIASTTLLERAAPAYGVRTVAPGYVTPVTDDDEVDERRTVNDAYLTADARRRRQIVDRYQVGVVLVDESVAPGRLADHVEVLRFDRYRVLRPPA